MDNIRNISIIAHVDAGKSTISDSFLSRAGLVNDRDAGKKRQTDTRKDEQERGITIKSVGVTMELTYKGQNYKINLVDSPGHVDFSSEVTAAIRITDGAMIVIDFVEGVQVQTETVLRQAIQEGVTPILFINKLDRAFLELKEEPEKIYIKLVQIIESINALIMTYTTNENLCVDPLKGSVGFGCGYFAWGFTLNTFTELYMKKMPIENKEKFRSRMWGDHFYETSTKKWSTTQTKDSIRGFNQYILNVIQQIYDKSMVNDKTGLTTFLGKIDVKLSVDDLELNDRLLFGIALKRMMPIGETLMELVVNHIPNPKESQKNRVEILYDGDCTDECATGIRNCDPSGPLMIYISKMIPEKTGRFVAFGRVFSGTLRTGMKVFVQGTNYDPKDSRKKDYTPNVSIQRTEVMVAGKFEAVDKVECGNTCAIVGVDNYLIKTGTITDHPNASNIKTMKFTVSPVVTVAVDVKDATKLPTLVEGLRKLEKSDPCVLVKHDDQTGESIISATGELHMEICINDLKDFMKGTELIVKEPVVSFRESVLQESSIIALAKSPNNHNRLYMKCCPLSNELVNDIDNGDFNVKLDAKERAKILVEKYKWDPEEARKIWKFGPEEFPTCVLVDCTRGLQYLNEIKDSCIAGFEWALTNSPLTNEKCRGIKFQIMDVVLHPDAVHRGGGQIIGTMRNVMFASMLSAKPTLYEPIFSASITVPETKFGAVMTCINSRRGDLIDRFPKEGTPLIVVVAHIPVSESFGINEQLRSTTGGEAFPTLTFSHYDVVPGNVYESNNKVNDFVTKTRKRKGLKDTLPVYDDFNDKL